VISSDCLRFAASLRNNFDVSEDGVAETLDVLAASDHAKALTRDLQRVNRIMGTRGHYHPRDAART